MMKRTGLTLIEWLIVLCVAALLVAIVIPPWVLRPRQEADLRANLREMRIAVTRFKSDCGCFPAQLFDIMVTEAPKTGAGGEKIDPLKFKGPYLINPAGQLPKNPINSQRTAGVAGMMKAAPMGWIYDPVEGTVRAEHGTAADRTDYSTW